MSSNYATTTTPTITEADVFDAHNNGSNIAFSTNEYDAVMGFFLQKTDGNTTISANLADTVITIAAESGNSPMIMIDELEEYGITDIQQSIISLLNQTRNNTSILGFNKSQSPNNLVARNILS